MTSSSTSIGVSPRSKRVLDRLGRVHRVGAQQRVEQRLRWPADACRDTEPGSSPDAVAVKPGLAIPLTGNTDRGMERARTQVAIVGAGPAGLVLSHLLARAGIDCVVLEARSREYVEQRVRAGVLEQNTADLLDELGVGERMHREGLVHEGIELRFGGRGHRIDMAALTGGRAITVYGQQEVVKDLIAAGGDIRFEVDDVRVDVERPRVSVHPRGHRVRARLRGHRGLRRVPRRVPRSRPGRRAGRARARLPVRLAGHPGPRRAAQPRADLHPPRPRLRPGQHALAGGHAAVPAGAPGHGRGRLARRPRSGRRRPRAWRWRARSSPCRRARCSRRA